MHSSFRYLTVGGAFVALYAAANLLLASRPLALSLAGHAALVASAALVVVAVWRRRPSRAGCQRLFWDILAIGMALWIVGHFGWAYDDLTGRQSWLEWHTVFSLCAGIAPLIALLARPHLGVRHYVVGTIGVDLAAFGLLGIFIYSYFVLVPSLVPEHEGYAQPTLLVLIQSNRLLLFAGLLAAARAGWATAWRATYLRLALGTGIGLLLRAGTSLAIAQGEYHPGSYHDLAWIVPWLSYAWAAMEAPASPREELPVTVPQPPVAIAFSAVPVLLVPALGYGMLFVAPLGPPIDSFRALLTSVTTVGGLGLLTFRLAVQRGTLQRADARLRLLGAATEQTAELILITRADGTFEHANEAFVRALGYTRAELTGMHWTALLAGEPTALGRRIPQAVREHGIWRGSLLRRRKDGSTFPSACTVAALRSGAGGPSPAGPVAPGASETAGGSGDRGAITHYVGVERDISEELRLRDQLVHSERLSAIGELVAGVAHELNNPLQTIVGTVELMLDDRPGAVNRGDLEVVRREAARAGQIVRNLLTFVRRGSSDRVPSDLTQLVRATVDLREYHLRQQNITIEARYAPAPLPVLVNRDEVRQVVLNLLLNAEHAISTAAESGAIAVTTSAEDGLHVVDVADTGPGISPEIRGRVFEPFFTTKDVGEGTGLGLSISHGIASAHGGSLELRHADAGARFRLALPAYCEKRPRPDLSPPQAAVGPRRALVVDDEAPIRQLLVRLMQRRGYEVDEADTGEAAVELSAANTYQLVLCDVRMPGMGGLELHRRLTAASPHLAQCFVFMTGDAASLDPVRDGIAQAAVLSKPFTAADLDAVLARVGAD